MYDDAEWLKFGIDPHRRAALQTFVTALKRKVRNPDLRDDAEMEAYRAILMRCLREPAPDDTSLRSEAISAVRKFLRDDTDYNRIFPVNLEVVPHE